MRKDQKAFCTFYIFRGAGNGEHLSVYANSVKTISQKRKKNWKTVESSAIMKERSVKNI